MDNVTFFVNELDGIEYALISYADGSFTSMTKAYYDELEAQRQQSGTL